MGRGLSLLQRDILKLALRNTAIRTHGKPDVYYAEILHEHFDWAFKDSHATLEKVRDRPGVQYFARAEIGVARYNRDMAVLSRSVLRLEQRGLVESTRSMSRWAGANITDAGVRKARTL